MAEQGAGRMALMAEQVLGGMQIGLITKSVHVPRRGNDLEKEHYTVTFTRTLKPVDWDAVRVDILCGCVADLAYMCGDRADKTFDDKFVPPQKSIETCVVHSSEIGTRVVIDKVLEAAFAKGVSVEGCVCARPLFGLNGDTCVVCMPGKR